VRTLSSFSRALSAGAVVAAALLVLGGAYFVGYVGELQRTLNAPIDPRPEVAQQVAAIERALGYAGFLKAYRNYRTAGDEAARADLTRYTVDAEHAFGQLKKLYAGNPLAADALREAESAGEAFAHVAQTAPETGAAALRGTAGMNELSTQPLPPQLEASYLALRTALDRLRSVDQAGKAGSLASTLNWTQWVIIAAVGALVAGLLIAAALLQLGIIQPLKALERSLTAVGDGALTQGVWGAERTDEFGALARAGEKLRRTVTETAAVQELANKGRLHLTLDGQSSILLQRLADEVTQTTTALKTAAVDFARLQDGNRRHLEEALATLKASAAGTTDASETLRGSAAVTATVNEELANAMAGRLQRLDRLTEKFDHTRRQVAQTACDIGGRARAATEEITASAATLKTAAENVGQIQTTLSQAFDDISGSAVKSTDKVRTLAARLNETIGLVDERLSRKLAALDTLERTVTASLASLRAKTEEASLAINAKAGELGQAAGRDDELKAAIARLDEIAGRLANPAASAPNLDALSSALQGQLDTVRSELRDLAIRMTEERLLTTGSAPALTFAADAFSQTRTPQRTLADVPGEEIMARLKDLAAEMNAAHSEPDHAASLKSALGTFAAEVKDLAAAADRTPRLKAMGRALDQHAEEIEAHIPSVDPSSALKTELSSITSELRAIASRAQAGNGKDGAQLREAAIEAGARAESLFTYLNETHPDDATDDGMEPMPTAAGDIAALTQLIDRIEARATSLATPQALDTNGAIHAVFESIGRLNNIATALARASRSDRPRHATH
jgi:hypothetical protein